MDKVVIDCKDVAGALDFYTDELGFRAVEDRVEIPDLHATILHALGLNHERLTYYYNGLERRLTGIAGRVVTKLFA